MHEALEIVGLVDAVLVTVPVTDRKEVNREPPARLALWVGPVAPWSETIGSGTYVPSSHRTVPARCAADVVPQYAVVFVIVQ
jgi:hypothetical protein